MPFRVEWASAGRCCSTHTWMATNAIALVLTKALAVHLVPVSTRLLQRQGRGKSRQSKSRCRHADRYGGYSVFTHCARLFQWVSRDPNCSTATSASRDTVFPCFAATATAVAR
ncbi:hypothetical protein PR001_g11045 [Phytophthora rubi]|uniref:Uncharacterized protein n=1 Tax=Phytophthora rubi TaxID=129364 RepID=A0A6A3MPW2_9STRA|nr:hypothetical protein PR002_g10873 [Phytophthora rubi]KAE9031320.1 hypothetical protein PR001_g11045 [Phytophthora rubi]